MPGGVPPRAKSRSSPCEPGSTLPASPIAPSLGRQTNRQSPPAKASPLRLPCRKRPWLTGSSVRIAHARAGRPSESKAARAATRSGRRTGTRHFSGQSLPMTTARTINSSRVNAGGINLFPQLTLQSNHAASQSAYLLGATLAQPQQILNNHVRRLDAGGWPHGNAPCLTTQPHFGQRIISGVHRRTVTSPADHPAATHSPQPAATYPASRRTPG